MRNAKASQAERKAPRNARPAHGPQRPREAPGGFAAQVRALGPEGEDMIRRLAIVNEFGLWENCSREACRRAGKCRGDDVDCFDEQRAELKRAILQHVVWLLCTTRVSSGEFYDYLDEVTADPDEDGGGPEAW